MFVTPKGTIAGIPATDSTTATPPLRTPRGLSAVCGMTLYRVEPIAQAMRSVDA
jgi:hypothetical protein